MRFNHTAVSGLLAGTMLVAGATSTFAATSHKALKLHARAHLVLDAGQVSNLTPAGFTLTWTPKKATVAPKIYQITVVPTTKAIAAKNTTGVLQNGEYALVVGAKTTAGVTARNIRFSTTPYSARTVSILRARLRLRELTAAKTHALHGIVTTASATELAVTTKAGKPFLFAVTATTKFRVNRVLQTTAPSFTAGEKVVVYFRRNRTTKAFDALSIVVRTA